MCCNYKPNSSPNQTHQSTYIGKAGITSCCLSVYWLTFFPSYVLWSFKRQKPALIHSRIYHSACHINRCSINGGWINVKNIKMWKGKVVAIGHRASKHTQQWEEGKWRKERKKPTCSPSYSQVEERHTMSRTQSPDFTAETTEARKEKQSAQNQPPIIHGARAELGLLCQIVSLSPMPSAPGEEQGKKKPRRQPNRLWRKIPCCMIQVATFLLFLLLLTILFCSTKSNSFPLWITLQSEHKFSVNDQVTLIIFHIKFQENKLLRAFIFFF